MSKKPETETIGIRLRRLRLARGMSQRELASPGVSYAYISRIEAGTRHPSVKALRSLAKKLEVSPDYLETGSEIRDVDERELRLADAELRLRLDSDSEATRQTFAQILEDAVDAGDLRSATRARIGLGLASAELGDHAEAAAQLAEATEMGDLDPALRPDVFGMLGRSYAALGQIDRAIALFEECVQAVEEGAPENITAYTRYASNLSSALADHGELGEAEAVLKRALERAGDSADSYTLVRLYWSLARVAEFEGRAADALDYTRRAIALLEATDDTVHLARAHLLCAWIMGTEGKSLDAVPHLEQAERLFTGSATPADLALLRIEQARSAAQLGRGGEAVARARHALELLGEHHEGEQGSAWWSLGEGLALEGDIDAAADAFEKGVGLLDETHRWREAAQCCRRWAKVLRDAGRDAEALDALERATDYAVRTQPTTPAPISH